MIELPPATRENLEAEEHRLKQKIERLRSEIETCEAKITGIRAILGTGGLQEVFEERTEGQFTVFVDKRSSERALLEKLEAKENQKALLELLAGSEEPLSDEEVRAELELEGTHAIAGLRGAINKQAKNLGLSNGQLILHKEERDETNGRVYQYYLAPEPLRRIRALLLSLRHGDTVPPKEDAEVPDASGKTLGKTDFVRRFIADHKGCLRKDILDAATKAGIEMKPRYLYAVVGRLYGGKEIKKRKHRLYATEKMKSVSAPG